MKPRPVTKRLVYRIPDDAPERTTRRVMNVVTTQASLGCPVRCDVIEYAPETQRMKQRMGVQYTILPPEEHNAK